MGLIVDSRQVQPGPVRFKGVIGQLLMNADSGSPTVQMSVLTLEPGAILPLHVHVDAESFFVLEGSGIATVDGVEHPINAEMALLAPGGEVHGFSNNGDQPLRVLCVHPVGRPQTKFLE